MAYDQFTNPAQPWDSSAQGRPEGAGDQGETWDPVQNRWVPRGQMPAQSAPGPAAPGQAEPPQYAGPNAAGFSRPGEAGQGPGQNKDPYAWGGYGSTNQIDPVTGQSVANHGMSGATADQDRYRRMAEEAAKRGTYQNDYGQADKWAKFGEGSRQNEQNAIDLSRGVATNGDQISQALGRRTLAQGANAQVAGARSARGGSLAAGSALMTQQRGQAGYMQRGGQALAAQRADDMARGRGEYMAATTGMRAGDVEAQRLNQQQALAQGENELARRGGNDTLENGLEDLRFGVLSAEQKAGLKRAQTGAGIYTNQLDVERMANERNAKNIGSALDAGGTLSKKYEDTYGDADRKKSDERAKTPMSMASASARKRY
jgi:hypothetical protein